MSKVEALQKGDFVDWPERTGQWSGTPSATDGAGSALGRHLMTIRNWYQRQFSNPQTVSLVITLLLGFGVVFFLGTALAPIWAAVVIAYLLEGLVGGLERMKLARLPAVLVVFLGFLLFLSFVLFSLLPLLLGQVTEFLQSLPTMMSHVMTALQRLPEMYPNLVSEKEIQDLVSLSRSEIMAIGQRMLSFSVVSLAKLVYLVLVPFLVFFFLKDKSYILKSIGCCLPRNRELVVQVWHQVDREMGNYLRGKSWEVLIVWGVSSPTFALLGLEVPVLLGLLAGISVLIPYIGVVSMTLPVALVAYFQWGLGWNFVYVMIAYTVIQMLDGNLLAPLLLSEVLHFHPVVIILAVLFFGGLWGFWGVFFALPLATLVRAIFDAWPRAEPERAELQEAAG